MGAGRGSWRGAEADDARRGRLLDERRLARGGQAARMPHRTDIQLISRYGIISTIVTISYDSTKASGEASEPACQRRLFLALSGGRL